MKSLKRNIETWMGAVAFAEAGEHEVALQILGARSQKTKTLSLNDVMVAITFAEAGMTDVARAYMGAGQPPTQRTVSAPPDPKAWRKIVGQAA